MRILVTGSRDWEDLNVVYRVLTTLVATHGLLRPIGPTVRSRYDMTGWVIVHGACPTGADAFADAFARGNQIAVERHPADWERHGKAAGPIRNREMVELGADLCLAFIRNRSRGASGCAALAEAAGIPTIRHTND